MGIQADTATADPGALLGGADGFTAGDAQQGIAPTQVSPTFLNGICDEINAVIIGLGDAKLVGDVGDVPDPIDFGNQQQLNEAILRRIAFQDGYSPGGAYPPWYRRTHAANVSSVDHKWCTWFRNSSRIAVSDNTVENSGHLVVPDESVFWVTFTVNVVRSDSILFLKNVILRALCRRTGGACYVDQQTVVDSFGALGATFTVIATTFSGFPAVAVETTLPVSVGKTFNIAISVEASNVTTGT